jgi:hypothetical protein
MLFRDDLVPAALEEILLLEAKDGVVPENREHMYTERKRQRHYMIEVNSYRGKIYYVYRSYQR